MAQIKWDNVAPVNLTDAARAYAEAGNAVKQGLATLSNTATAYKGMQQEEANKQLANNISKYNNSSDLSDAYKSGALYNGVNTDWLDAAHIGDVQNKITTQAKNERDDALALFKTENEKAQANKAYVDANKAAIEARNSQLAAQVPPDDMAQINQGLPARTPEGQAYQATQRRPNFTALQQSAANNAAGKMIAAFNNQGSSKPEISSSVYQALNNGQIDGLTAKAVLEYYSLKDAPNGVDGSGSAAMPGSPPSGTGLNSKASQAGVTETQGMSFGKHAQVMDDEGRKTIGVDPNNPLSRLTAAGLGQITLTNLRGKNHDGLWYQAGKKDEDAFNLKNQDDVVSYMLNKNMSNPKALKTYWNFLPDDVIKSGDVNKIKDAIYNHENGHSYNDIKGMIANEGSNSSSNKQGNAPAEDKPIFTGNESPIDIASRVTLEANQAQKKLATQTDPLRNDASFILMSGKNEDKELSPHELQKKYDISGDTWEAVHKELGNVPPHAIAALINNFDHSTSAIRHPLNRALRFVTGMSPEVSNAIQSINKNGGYSRAYAKYNNIASKVSNLQSSIDNAQKTASLLSAEAKNGNNSPESLARRKDLINQVNTQIPLIHKAAS